MSQFICKKCNKEGIKSKNRLECVDCRQKFVTEYKRKWAESNEEYKEKQFRYREIARTKSRDDLDDAYIKHTLRVKGFKKTTKEIIELQRLILKNKRLCKTLQT